MMQRKRSREKRRGGWIRKSLIFVLFLVSLALIFNTSIRNMLIARSSNQYQLEHVTKEEITENKSKEATFDFDKVEPISTEAVLKSQWDVQQLPVIGAVAMPDLGVNLPIFKGLSNTALMYGAGTMKEDQEMGKGNYALASHHIFGIAGASDVLFSPLEKAQAGMKIYVTDKETVYTYVVTSVESVEPERVDVIEDTLDKTEITLVTCEDAAAVKRTIVKGVLESSTPFDQTDKNILDSFEKPYNQVQL